MGELSVRQCHDIMATKVKQINVSVFAKVGNGKSSSANTLLLAWGYDGPGFDARRQREMVTSELQTIAHKFKDPDAPSIESSEPADEGEDGEKQRGGRGGTQPTDEPMTEEAAATELTEDCTVKDEAPAEESTPAEEADSADAARLTGLE